MAGWETAGKVLPGLFTGPGLPPALPSGPPPLAGKRSHEIDYEIIGESIQMVEVELDPGETVIAEGGAMNYMEDGIAFETKMGDGSTPDSGFMGKLMAVGKRALTGESIFMTHFTNRVGGKKRVTFAAPYPGTVVPVDLSQQGGELLCQKDAFLCAALGTQIGIAFNRKLGAGLFGGEGFILQRLQGDGMAFIHAGGTVVRKELKGERLYVDTGCLVALHQGDRLRHPAGGESQVDGIRRRGPVPPDAARARHGLAAKHALRAPGAADHRDLRQRPRAGIRDRRAGEPVRRLRGILVI